MRTSVKLYVGLGVLVLAAGALMLMRMGAGGMMGHGMRMGASEGGVSVLRHRYVMTHGLLAMYADARNPLAQSAENIQAGKALFAQNCVACHGSTGRGDGVVAKGLAIRPTDLAAALRMPMSSDAYLLWTLAEGGAPVASAMPAFKALLSQDDLWRITLYLRTL